jgi:hypothetical protein
VGPLKRPPKEAGGSGPYGSVLVSVVEDGYTEATLDTGSTPWGEVMEWPLCGPIR